MKIVHTADWHIGRFLNEFSLIHDQEYYLNQLFNLLKEEKVDALIISGDIYDRSIPPVEAVTLVDEIFLKIIKELNVKIFAIAGNHDSPQRLNFAKNLYQKSGLYMESFYKNQITKYSIDDKFGKVNFYMLPYTTQNYLKSILPKSEKLKEIKTADDCFKYIIKNENIDESQRNILISHGFFGYSKDDDILLSDSELNVGGTDICDIKIAENFDYIALGHLHSPQKLGKNHIRYSGSMLKYSLSEVTQKKSITIIELKEKGEISIEQKEIKPLHDLHILNGSLAEILTNNQKINENDYCFVNLTDDGVVLDAMAKLRSVFKNVLGVKLISFEKIINNNSKNLIKIQAKNELELFCDFYKETSGEELTGNRLEIMSEIIKSAKQE